jgi:hypothetical protein
MIQQERKVLVNGKTEASTYVSDNPTNQELALNLLSVGEFYSNRPTVQI